MPASLLNGERAVVALFVGRVVFSLPLSLLPHGVALSLLAISALVLDVLADSSSSSSASLLSHFQTRPGASSGILLGAVTLPTVMISKMIQLSRAFALDQVPCQELESLSMQYWAISASSLSVLIFLCITIWCAPVNWPPPYLRSVWHTTFSLSCIVLHTAVCCATLGSSSLTSSEAALKLLWMLCHGLAVVKLIQHVFRTFPSCASIGEACLVASGLVLYFGDMLAYTISKVSGVLIKSDVVQYGNNTSEINVIIQGFLLGLLLFPMVFKLLLWIWECSFTTAQSKVRTNNEIWRSVIFFSSLGFIMIVISPAWMQFVQDFHMHPFSWVLSFIFSEPFKRLSLCAYWVCVICVSVLRFYNISKNSKIERILLRKYYHLMAVSMFVPALIFQPKFLDLAFGAALAVFLSLEIVRVWRIWPLGECIHKFMSAFTDHRDSDLLIVSHFSLLLGCAVPIWLSSGNNDRPLSPFSGILSLGIGDTMASVVGHKYGVLRWSKTGKKTIEGTAAGITSVLAACSVLLPLLASTGYIVTEHWISILVAVTVSGLLEAYTAQLDNAFIPLVFYSLLCL
ncbi:dolichol kinase EVAN [Argentina anserina]|uniref:dolichol kinase EVAN n=1 Tax=Argentina anserina TaxID=57926 RepID=UPI0021767F09|nr:dolichol kinase EVAN [Potentilla anserina]